MRSCDINYDTANGVFDFSAKRMVVSDFRSGKLWNGAKLKYIRELNFNGGSLSQEHIDDIPQVGILQIIGNFLPAITSFKMVKFMNIHPRHVNYNSSDNLNIKRCCSILKLCDIDFHEDFKFSIQDCNLLESIEFDVTNPNKMYYLKINSCFALYKLSQIYCKSIKYAELIGFRNLDSQKTTYDSLMLDGCIINTWRGIENISVTDSLTLYGINSGNVKNFINIMLNTCKTLCCSTYIKNNTDDIDKFVRATNAFVTRNNRNEFIMDLVVEYIDLGYTSAAEL